tara:strand:+ start:1847 stop:3013 length:1167 start_codon:yes stop_codon:yes gene_type:complete
MKKKISILGSTGSVGLSSLKIIDKQINLFEPYLFSANKNFSLICKQIIKYKPDIFIINEKNTYEKVKEKFKNKKIKIRNNFNLNIKKKSEITISAIPGIAGLYPTLQIMRSTKKMLIANKESIICGWELIKNKSKKTSTKIIPIDSEHFSIFSLLKGHSVNEINKVYLTASGGPFLNFSNQQLKIVKPHQALKHPKWKMGKKITIDSATLMNKILELAEAQKLFNIPNEKIEILIHPQSLVHAIIDFKNGLKKFIYHETSMLVPIANAIFEKNFEIKNILNIRGAKIKNLYFDDVNVKTFPIIKLKNRINEYPSSSIIINASNEILVDQFLHKKLPFLNISKIIMDILGHRNYKKYAIQRPKNINQIKKIDFWAREVTLNKILKNVKN